MQGVRVQGSIRSFRGYQEAPHQCLSPTLPLSGSRRDQQSPNCGLRCGRASGWVLVSLLTDRELHWATRVRR